MRLLGFSLLVVALSLPPGGTAGACGFHGTLANGLGVPYPGAMSVAISIAEARRDGLLPARTIQSRSAFAYQAALARLGTLQSRLAASPEESDFSLLFVTTDLWTHYRVGGVLPHAQGPIPGRPVVMTDDAVLDAVLEGTLGVGEAFDRGLIAVTGDGGAEVAARLISALRRPA